MSASVRRIVSLCKIGRVAIIFLIVLNSVAAGLLTNPDVRAFCGRQLVVFCDVSSVLFIIEILARMWFGRRNMQFFTGRNRKWNWFDFIIVAASSIGLFCSGSSSLVSLRIFRQLRVLRLFTRSQNLKVIIDALLSSVSKLAWTSVFFLIIFYLYSVMGVDFYARDFPQWFGGMGRAAFTLFQVMTFEGWAEISREVMELHPYSWLYFISFIFIVSYTLVNVIVGIIVSSLDRDDDRSLEEVHRKLDAIMRNMKE